MNREGHEKVKKEMKEVTLTTEKGRKIVRLIQIPDNAIDTEIYHYIYLGFKDYQIFNVNTENLTLEGEKWEIFYY